MSRTNRGAELKNPAQKFFEWSSEEKTFVWYDKAEKIRKRIELPFTFLVLDQLSTVSGWSDADQSGIWSNEIRDTRRDILTVRTKLGIKDVGIYEKVKNVPGARYARSLYIAYKEGEELTLGHIKLIGSANGSWIEFTKSVNDIYDGAVKVAGFEEGKKGATTYYYPIFQMTATSEQTLNIADALDIELQAYLDVYLARNVEDVPPDDADDFPTHAGGFTPNPVHVPFDGTPQVSASADYDDNEIPF